MIEIKALSYTYAGRSEATLHGLDFAIQEGEIFGFLGPSGSGKSTTQKILIGLLKGYKGQARFLEREISGWGEALYEEIGVAFEVPRLFQKLTARENLRYFGALYRGPCTDGDALLARFGLSEDADTLVSQFSKGMRSRLNVARALLHKPRLLFLDEPTSGLDPSNVQSMKECLREQQQAGTTVFLTTHDMHVAEEVCDRVAFLVDGHIRLIDKPRELKLRHGQKAIRLEYTEQDQLQHAEFPMNHLAENTEFQRLLRHPGLQTIHTQETSLDRIFMEVTGHTLHA
ncbi:ABC transporter ATP-binding protein [Myxococcota bacterium]|nr:ABC transporter ATP-binding protein [Myxococcota bacterium]